MNYKEVKEVKEQLQVELELHAIQEYLEKPIIGKHMLARARTRKGMAVDKVREKFKIPKHIPYTQFRKYLLVLEGRLKCQLNKT